MIKYKNFNFTTAVNDDFDCGAKIKIANYSSSADTWIQLAIYKRSTLKVGYYIDVKIIIKEHIKSSDFLYQP